jgi:hypothetical protein
LWDLFMHLGQFYQSGGQPEKALVMGAERGG